MLPENLYRNVFPAEEETAARKDRGKFDALAQHHLAVQGIKLSQPKQMSEEDTRRMQALDSIQLPKLVGKSIVEHFEAIGSALAYPYRDKAYRLARIKAPPMPEKWHMAPGWTRYDATCEKIESVPYPLEEDLVFDVEVAMRVGPLPTLAVAMTSSAWYGWCGPDLFRDDAVERAAASDGMLEEDPPASEPGSSDTLDSAASMRLISLGPPSLQRLVVGHAVSFDRIRVLEEYHIGGTSSRFLDTMSLHCSVSGLSSQQRASWMRWSLSRDFDADDSKWAQFGSLNSLKEVLKLHCNVELDKRARDIFISGALSDIKADFTRLILYCANDVFYTHQLFCTLWPKYLAKCPSPVTLYGNLTMSTCYLPTDSSWVKFIQACDAHLHENTTALSAQLRALADHIVNTYQKDALYEQDPWLKFLDWTPVPEKWTQGLKNPKTGEYKEGHLPKPIGNLKFFGRPEWYKKLYDSKAGDIRITPRSIIVAYLLRLSWKGQPVHYIAGSGWTFEVAPRAACFSLELTEKGHPSMSPLPADLANARGLEDEDSCERFVKDPRFPALTFCSIPHADANRGNVGNLLTKSFVSAFESGLLSSCSPLAMSVMSSNTTYSFWTSYRARAKRQLLVLEEVGQAMLGFESRREGCLPGAILPQIVTMGTVTRRAVEGLWLTSSNSQPNLVGSELKSRITAPRGWVFVGADVDSQELWLSSLAGDAQFGEHGSTAFGWMTLAGSKSNGSDLHSRTAGILGIKRDDAKIFNYGRIYGAGQAYAAQLLRKFNPDISKQASEELAQKLYAATKGKKSKCSSLSAELRLWLHGARGASDSPCFIYRGGSESYMFNELERIAVSDTPRTAGLGCSISDALSSEKVDNHSSGADYLHLLIAAMGYLIKIFDIQARLCISIHDEVRYLVKEEDRYRAALALQISNLWTRALFSKNWGLNDLPLSVAFFSGVDIDTVLRKEVSTPCLTPSNKDPIPPGECLDMHQLLIKCNSLEPPQRLGLRENCDSRHHSSIERLEFERVLQDAAFDVASLSSLPSCRSMYALSKAGQLEWLRLQENLPLPKTRKDNKREHLF